MKNVMRRGKTTSVKAYHLITAKQKNCQNNLLRTKEKLSTVKKKNYYENKNVQVMCN